jgi:hypothetical protein
LNNQLDSIKHAQDVMQEQGFGIVAQEMRKLSDQSARSIREHLSGDDLHAITFELNALVGSSETTCIEGG